MHPPAGSVAPAPYLTRLPTGDAAAPDGGPRLFGAAAATTPAGRLSSRFAESVRSDPFGFPNAIVSAERSPAKIVDSGRAFEIVGGTRAAGTTPRLALAGCWFAPALVESYVATTRFVYVPGIADVTSTEIVHPVVAGIGAPLA